MLPSSRNHTCVVFDGTCDNVFVCVALPSMWYMYMHMSLQYAAKNGYDCIWLDLEHRAMNHREVQALLQLGVTHDIDIMVRSPSTERTQLYRSVMANVLLCVCVCVCVGHGGRIDVCFDGHELLEKRINSCTTLRMVLCFSITSTCVSQNRPRTHTKKGRALNDSRYFEDGATGVMLPLQNTAEDVASLVEKVKFPPIGNRGIDAAGVDAAFGDYSWGTGEHSMASYCLCVKTSV